MFRASLCPSSVERLYKTAPGVSLITPDAVLYSLSTEDGHNDARNMLS